MNMTICPYADTDRDALYNICIRTGHAGGDAYGLYADKKLLGHIYVGPYLTCYPELAYVLKDGEEICGYVLASLDTNYFHGFLRHTWYPMLQDMYPREKTKGNSQYTAHDRKLLQFIQNPQFYTPLSLHTYPSELHIDLMPRVQRQGWGSKMIDTLLTTLREKKSKGVHLGVDPANTRARLFYEKLGFTPVSETSGNTHAHYMAKALLS